MGHKCWEIMCHAENQAGLSKALVPPLGGVLEISEDGCGGHKNGDVATGI